MPAERPEAHATSLPRRVPTQARSRHRVERVLDAAAGLVVRRGVESLSTRDIASAAGMPVASLYQYFADKDDVLLALAERDMAEMDAQVLEDLGAAPHPTVASLVRTVMSAFVTVYHRRRAFVEIYLRGRNNTAIREFGRDHNQQVAATMLAYAQEAGLATPALTHQKAVLAVEIGDRVFQLAFEDDDDGDPVLLEEGIVLVTAYLERYATPAGLGA